MIRYFAFCLFVLLAGVCVPNAGAQYHTTTSVSDLPPLEQSCRAGNKNGCELLVRYYDSIAKHGGDRGLTVDQAFTLKLDWAEKSCEVGGSYGCDAAGWAYEHGQESRNQDYEKAFIHYKKGCEVRSGLSCNNLALAYQHGRGTSQNEQTAEAYFAKACQYSFEGACPKTEEPAQDPKQSYDDYLKQYRLDGFKSSCASGKAESCWALGWEEVKNKTITQGSAAFKAQMAKACEMGHQQACNDIELSPPATSRPAGQTSPVKQPQTYSQMNVGALETVCVQEKNVNACKALYGRIRGDDPDSYVMAEHICLTWGYPDYCYDAGIDLYSGGAGVRTNKVRAFNNFHSACYNRSSKSCYMAAHMSLSGDGVRTDYAEAYLLFNMSCTSGYRDSCALMRRADRMQRQANAARDRGIRANEDDAMNCKKTRIVGNGGRTYTSYDCRTNRQWRTGKK